jgi:hypothetical protein
VEKVSSFFAGAALAGSSRTSLFLSNESAVGSF